MTDIVLGFLVGSVLTTWLFYLKSREEKWAKRPEALAFKELTEKRVKPDLEKARYHQSAIYKNQKAFCERMKKGELE